ncbi:hypothetical protein BRADI_4g27396v3 [Brachypodium distachyon]|uniref:Myb/SANT-like domain-containing protein n=1 Tax=Brachypodium distachyon TaxID=15368 RepID=A0A2K2CQN7_BRADI|nr:hypothetical protein BRADI_4g27396v3 [Brachypodium distachyon]
MEPAKVEPVKAVWDATAARIFCECATKQVQLGNRPTKFLSATGYKNLVADFNAQTGRNYERRQLKNRWDDLKAIYSAWVFYKIKATGLGWNEETQTIIADEEQWTELIKLHKPIKAFRKGPPDNLDLMHIMFDKANVDGTTSVMPGVEETETPTVSPWLKKRPKRPSSAIPCSPSNPKKTNMSNEFQRFVDHVVTESSSNSTTTEANEIAAIMEEVAKCGASDLSDEHYIATKLFAKSTNCSFFLSMKTKEGKLNWLNRQYEDMKRN